MDTAATNPIVGAVAQVLCAGALAFWCGGCSGVGQGNGDDLGGGGQDATGGGLGDGDGADVGGGGQGVTGGTVGDGDGLGGGGQGATGGIFGDGDGVDCADGDQSGRPECTGACPSSSPSEGSACGQADQTCFYPEAKGCTCEVNQWWCYRIVCVADTEEGWRGELRCDRCPPKIEWPLANTDYGECEDGDPLCEVSTSFQYVCLNGQYRYIELPGPP